MEFVESHSRQKSAHGAALFTVTHVHQRSNWVRVPNPLASQLLDLGTLPVVLQLRALDAAGYPSKQPAHTHYVAWVGDVHPRAGEVGLPSELAAALGLQPSTSVTVSPVLDVPEATVVEVEPASESDWEVVEANAGFLEDSLLQQVRVLSQGQLFPVWARGSLVRLRALSTQPAPLVRLVAGCELHVAPRPRALVGAANGSGPAKGAAGGQARKPAQQGAAAKQQQQQQQQQTVVPLAGANGGSSANGWGRHGDGHALATGGRGAPPQPVPNGLGHSHAAPPPRRDSGGAGAAAGGAAGGGPGLMARPAWAGALTRPPPGRSAGEATAGAAGSAAAAALSKLASTGGGVSGAGRPASGQGPAAVAANGHAGSSHHQRHADQHQYGQHSAPGAPRPSQPPHSQDTHDQHRHHNPQQGQGPLEASGPSQASGDGRLSTESAQQQLPPPQQSASHLAPSSQGQAESSAASHGPGQPTQAHPQQQQHILHPQALRLRVLNPPAAKYIVPLPHDATAGTKGDGRGNGSGTAPGQAATATAVAVAPEDRAAATVSAWLTLAVAVAPATAAALLGLSPSPSGTVLAAALVQHGTITVRIHGCGTVRDLLGVLVPEPCCPPGHVMLAPPLQHVLSVLPHMHVTVTALPPPPATAFGAAGAAAAAAELAALPSLKLHPLPVPSLRFESDGVAAAAAPAAGRSGAAAVPAASSQAPAGSDDVDQHRSVVLAAAPGAVAGGTKDQALSHAVHSWLAAQLDGIRRAMLEWNREGTSDSTSTNDKDAANFSFDPEVHLPLASGAVVHLRIYGNGIEAAPAAVGKGTDGQNSSTAAAESAPPASPRPGDYCLIVHAVRRANGGHAGSAAAGAPPAHPPLVSRRALSALTEAAALAAAAPTAATQRGTQRSPAALAVELGAPVQLPDVSYASARHAAALVARPLPSPPLPAAQPPDSASASLEKNDTTAPAASATSQPSDAAAASSSLRIPGLGLDLSHISWLGEQLEGCLRRLLPQMDPWVSAAVARAGLPRCGGVLVTGPPGSGRSPLLAALGDAAERLPGLQAHVMHVRCAQLAGGTPNATTSALSALASEALSCAPCLLLLDDLDALCPSAADGPEYGMQHPDGAAAAARLADWLAALLDELAAAAASGAPSAGAASAAAPPPAVAVVASARDAAAVHAVLRRVGRLDFEVRLPTPGSRGRAAMLAAAARQRGVEVDGAQLGAVAGSAEGFEGVDLRLLLDRAVHVALRRQLQQKPLHGALTQVGGPGAAAGMAQAPQPQAPAGPRPALQLSVSESDLRAALEGFVPAAFWGVQQAAEAGGRAEGWEDVGGLADVVSSLREALTLPIKYRQLVGSAPLRLRTGALLYGPPGCGKTHVVGAAVAAVAKLAPVRFLSVKGPELLNKYIGASEAAVRDLFARAAAAAPAVLFFDEFDAIAPPRGHDSTGVTDRVVNQLLTELDGVEGLRGVVVLAATSRPDLIDAALLRPGRLDRLLYCGPPEGPAERLQVLRALSRRLNLAPDVELSRVAERSGGMTGADLGAILSEAQLHAVNEKLEAATAAAAAAAAPTAADSPAAAATATTAGPAEQAPAGGSSGTGGSGASSSSAAFGSGSAAAADDAKPGADASTDAGGGGAAATPAGPVIRMRHVERALVAARPSLPPSEAARLSALYARFRQDRQAPAGRPGPGEAGSPEERQGTRATLA